MGNPHAMTPVTGPSSTSPRDGLPVGLRPMLAAAGDPPAGLDWAGEFKWDGMRILAGSAGGRIRLSSRNGNDLSGAYPELANAAGGGEWVGGRPVLLDGEVVALDVAGRPDFGRLQQRMQLRRPGADVVARLPVAFYVFDVLHLGERSLLGETYDVRRAVLAELELGPVGSVVVPGNASAPASPSTWSVTGGGAVSLTISATSRRAQLPRLPQTAVGDVPAHGASHARQSGAYGHLDINELKKVFAATRHPDLPEW